jgi:flagellar basal body P-ring formation protein FlgA
MRMKNKLLICYNYSMHKFILFIVFFLNLGAYELHEDYLFESQIIYSNDLFPDLTQKFEILRIPDDQTRYRINAQIISKSFELHGIAIDTAKVRYVNFTRKSPIDFTPLQQQLSNALMKRYPTMTIEHITIAPRGYLKSIPKGVQAVYDPKFFQSAKGTFYIPDEQGVRCYLDYLVTGNITVLHTTQKVSRKDPLNGSNTQRLEIPFSIFKDIPITELPAAPYRFRSTLKENTLLTERTVEPIPLVLQGQKVTVVVQTGTVSIEFGATATQEGALYDMITVQKSDGKRVKAKVIGENRVELL